MTRPPSATQSIHGILNINKPKDATSMDVVRQVKRGTRVKRVGHAGTLDPIATGVLPICLGQATRLMEFMVEGVKIYRAEFTLGVATDTYDAYGTPTSQGDWSSVTRAQVEALLPVFVGTIQQTPPMYSALKHEGKRLYDLARAGIQVERSSREVSVSRLELLNWAPPLIEVEAECGRGFYMRTLAHDLGAALGCGAHLSALARLRSGQVRIEDSLTIEQFQLAADSGDWEALIEPPDFALLSLPAITLAPPAEAPLRNGLPVAGHGIDPNARHLETRRAYAADGRFLGLVRFDRSQNQWRPEKLFTLPLPSQYASA